MIKIILFMLREKFLASHGVGRELLGIGISEVEIVNLFIT